MDNTSNSYKQGSITIFLALSLTLILSVLFSTIDSARRLALTSYLDGITRIALDSVFSSYCKQLWEDYHVFALVTSQPEFLGNLEEYIEKNIDNTFLAASINEISINDFSYISNNYGEHFIDQVLAYMKYKEISYIADYIFSESPVEYDASGLVDLADGELKAEDFEALDFGSLYNMVTSSNNSFLEQDFSLDFSVTESFSLDALKNITHIFDDTLLYYVVENTNDLSFKSIEYKGLPSSYIEIPKNELLTEYDLYDKFLFCEYIINNFSSYTNDVKDIPLDYQIEYLLQGMFSDDTNLLYVVKKLVLLRFSFNVIHILSNKEKTNSLSLISNSVCTIPAIPIIIQILLACVWALSESVIDVRDLLAGNNVPLFKTNEDWSLSLDNIMTFDYYTESANKDNDGLSYNNYLEILLVKEDIHTLSLRALDLIQLDISKNINSSFLISNCIVGTSCSFIYYSSDLFAPMNFHYNPLLTPEYNITQNYYYQ